MNTTWQRALAIPATVSIALGGALISVAPAMAAEPAVTPTSETSAPPAPDAVVTETPAAVETPAEEALITDPTEAPVAETPATDAPAEVPIDDAVETPAEEAPVADPTEAPVAETPATDADAEVPADDADESLVGAAAIAAAPVVTSPAPESTVTVTPQDGGTPRKSPVTFTGTAQPGAVVKIRLDPSSAISGVQYAEVPVAADGSWSTTLTIANTVWDLTTRQYEAGADGAPTGVASPETKLRFVLKLALEDAPAAPVMISPVNGAQIEPTVAQGANGDVAPVRIVITGVPGAKAEFSYREIGGNGYRTAVPEPTIPASGTLTYDAYIPAGKWRISTRQYLVTAAGTQLSEKSAISGGRAIDLHPKNLAAPTITSPRAGAVVPTTVEYPTDYIGASEDAAFPSRPTAEIRIEGTGIAGGYVDLTTTGGGYSGRYAVPVGADGRWSFLSYEQPGRITYSARSATYADERSYDTDAIRRVSETTSIGFTVEDRGVGAVTPAGSTGGAGTATGTGTSAGAGVGPGGSALAYTGTDERTATVGLIGGLLVALGLGALVVARRRRSL
ncbi:hypothetical protein [Frigoribacterium faeni]|uniref:Gram-positive cocci surface proteins LPxTG domain-containing protein n=1 Tax=Frigoribacterium faeni TaxID=145483 RepID=A0A7W3JJY0_9MICO|nr:hypothetical protein [Frigoribacterium faeni]MBA8814277.1 hypothetical protein [Frigoribacterium faeni]BFF12701.1 hypothetical protein GCM10025699_40040 [Microbacterium flavescens]BFF16347.1 hypothetical protein GCM10025699_76500 [Microbacterium flavescens]GEK83631.1 hypothetical protein FFA01_19400 [Frigoribacterium faeni]